MSSFLPQPSAITLNTTPSLSSSSPYPQARFSRPLLQMPILRTDYITIRFFGMWSRLIEPRLLDWEWFFLAADEEEQESMLKSSSVGHEQSMRELILL
jgi:hypothetical protein